MQGGESKPNAISENSLEEKASSAGRDLKRLIIFDFDGVLADSEILSNTVIAEILTGLGVPTTLDDSLKLFMGKRFHEVIAAMEAAVGHSLPEDFPQFYQERTLSRFRQDLSLIE